MGFLNHNGTVTPERLVRDIELQSAAEPVVFGNVAFNPKMWPQDPDYGHRQLFLLDRGVRGSMKRVAGEQLGIIEHDAVSGDHDAPVAKITLPVKAGILAIEMSQTEVFASDVPPEVASVDSEEFCKQIIARAVLKTANGDHQ